MDYNADKYLVEDSDLLTEAEKIQMARSLRELELKGVIEWRDGTWKPFICDACLIKLEAAINGPDLCLYHSEFCDKCRRKLDELGLG